jgi:hypothetical protein
MAAEYQAACGSPRDLDLKKEIPSAVMLGPGPSIQGAVVCRKDPALWILGPEAEDDGAVEGYVALLPPSFLIAGRRGRAASS